MGNPPAPAVQQRVQCPLGRPCHISGSGIRKFGTKFPQPLVEELASSSVALVQNGTPPKRFASGTLVDMDIVLCAEHSLTTLSTDEVKALEILLCFECNDQTAPPGARYQYRTTMAKWRTCTLLNIQPQATVIQILEKGSATNIDYALLRIEWKPHLISTHQDFPGAKLVKLPRKVRIPKPSRKFSNELLVIGYPWHTQGQGEPAQGIVGTKIREKGPHTLGGGDDYGYVEWLGSKVGGWSGGGVFNEEGEIIGVLKGQNPAGEIAFLNLGQAADKTDVLPDGLSGRLGQWFMFGRPRRTSDPSDMYLLTT
jgi:hypothetical protein